MHARHRVPANGYGSNPIGIGGGGGPAYRNYNNRSGFGRGHQKIAQPAPPPLPPPPSRRGGDVFMEAGRLATEYLISKGLLPANVLNGKWQNGSLKNHIGGGEYVPDAVSGTAGAMRRIPEDYSYSESRDGLRGRRRLGSFKNPEFEWNQKVTGSSDKQGDDDSVSGSTGKLQSGEDQKSVSGDLESKSCDAGNLEKNQSQSPDDNVCLKAPSPDASPEGGSNMMMDDNNNAESEKPSVKQDTPVENGNDLLSFIRFHKIPTRRRSSMAAKGPKINPVSIPNEENKNESHISTDVSMGDVASDERQESNRESKIPESPPAENVSESDRDYEHKGEVEHIAKKPRDDEGSFKICDLNLMEVSNLNENRDIGKTDDKEVEVVDLENDSGQDNKVFPNSERMDETIFTDLESFPDSMQRVNEMPQDGYGLMISELLDADIPNCSGSGVNPMHDQIGLRNDEGILDDDESIYMSLGEIPISFVPVWDQQPTRGYDKPY